jgi:hypothetical protein
VQTTGIITKTTDFVDDSGRGHHACEEEDECDAWSPRCEARRPGSERLDDTVRISAPDRMNIAVTAAW